MASRRKSFVVKNVNTIICLVFENFQNGKASPTTSKSLGGSEGGAVLAALVPPGVLRSPHFGHHDVAVEGAGLLARPRQGVTGQGHESGRGTSVTLYDDFLRLLGRLALQGIGGMSSRVDQLREEPDVSDGQSQGVHLGEPLLVGQRGYVRPQALERVVDGLHAATLPEVGRLTLLDLLLGAPPPPVPPPLLPLLLLLHIVLLLRIVVGRQGRRVEGSPEELALHQVHVLHEHTDGGRWGAAWAEGTPRHTLLEKNVSCPDKEKWEKNEASGGITPRNSRPFSIMGG